MPSTAPLTSTPKGTPCGTGPPSTSDVVRRPNASSTATTTPTDQPITSATCRTHRGRRRVGSESRGKVGRLGSFMTRGSPAGREFGFPAGDVRELVAPAAVQRNVRTVGAVGRRRRVGVPVDLANVRDAGVVVAAPVDEDEPRVVPLRPLVVTRHREQAVLVGQRRQLRPGGDDAAGE